MNIPNELVELVNVLKRATILNEVLIELVRRTAAAIKDDRLVSFIEMGLEALRVEVNRVWNWWVGATTPCGC